MSSASPELRAHAETVNTAIDQALIAVRSDTPINLDGLRWMVETLCNDAKSEAMDAEDEARIAIVEMLKDVAARMDGLEALLREKSREAED
ncbi:MAG: hypothetical protein RIC16_03340 [Rhodospirillales bacterium]